MTRWRMIILAACFIGALATACMLRYDVTRASDDRAYLLDRWTGRMWYLKNYYAYPVRTVEER